MFLFTKAFNLLVIVSVLFFSIGLYIVYFWIADNVTLFLIYKTANALLSSPMFYLSVLLVIGISIIFDVLYIMIIREYETPIYLMFKSLVENKNLNSDERERILVIISDKIKKNMYDL